MTKVTKHLNTFVKVAFFPKLFQYLTTFQKNQRLGTSLIYVCHAYVVAFVCMNIEYSSEMYSHKEIIESSHIKALSSTYMLIISSTKYFKIFSYDMY